jgi:hypothetical protein
MDDVKAFIKQIAGEIDDFYLLGDFADYVYPDSYFRRYTDEEAAVRNNALDQCLKVCEVYVEDCYAYIPWQYDIAKLNSRRSTPKRPKDCQQLLLLYT